jgi:hypothetical protein
VKQNAAIGVNDFFASVSFHNRHVDYSNASDCVWQDGGKVMCLKVKCTGSC